MASGRHACRPFVNGTPPPRRKTPGDHFVIKTILSSGAIALIFGAVPANAWAEESNPVADTETDGGSDAIVVFGRGEAKIGTAQAASEGSIGGSDVDRRGKGALTHIPCRIDRTGRGLLDSC